MSMRFDGWFGGIGLFGLVWLVLVVAFWVAIFVLALLAIRWLIRNTNDRPHAPGPPTAEDSAMATLRERYARGEIDAAEFEERKRTLGA